MKLTSKDLPGRCQRCHRGGYTAGKALDGRPEFKCGHCGSTWTSGESGFPYITPAGRAALEQEGK